MQRNDRGETPAFDILCAFFTSSSFYTITTVFLSRVPTEVISPPLPLQTLRGPFANLHLQVSHPARQTPRSGFSRHGPNDKSAVFARSGDLAHFTIRSPFVRLDPGDRVLVDSQQLTITANGNDSRAGRLGSAAGLGLTSRVGRFEPVESLVVQSTNTTTARGDPVAGGSGSEGLAGCGGIVQRVGEGPALGGTGEQDWLAVVTSGDQLRLGGERQCNVRQTGQSDRDVRSGGLTWG